MYPDKRQSWCVAAAIIAVLDDAFDEASGAVRFADATKLDLSSSRAGLGRSPRD
jgi:hypothetical protein